MKKHIIEFYFKIWLFLHSLDNRLNRLERTEHRVKCPDFDDYIDTLGSSQERGFFTYYYSCENYSQFTTRLPLKFRLSYYTEPEKILIIERYQYPFEKRLRAKARMYAGRFARYFILTKLFLYLYEKSSQKGRYKLSKTIMKYI